MAAPIEMPITLPKNCIHNEEREEMEWVSKTKHQ